jgi:hypothetical protein
MTDIAGNYTPVEAVNRKAAMSRDDHRREEWRCRESEGAGLSRAGQKSPFRHLLFTVQGRRPIH